MYNIGILHKVMQGPTITDHACVEQSLPMRLYCMLNAAAVTCDAFDVPSANNRNSSENTYNSYVKYTCDSGKRMEDGATYRVIKCDATGNWSDPVTACLSE